MKKLHYNKIECCTRTDENSSGSYYGGVGVQILIDGIVYIDGDDYYVDVDSFFQALAQQSAVISFIGGCHERGCCANGARTNRSPEAWCWNDSTIRLKWSDVYKVAMFILGEIERQISIKGQVWTVKLEKLPFYQTQLQLLENRLPLTDANPEES